MTSGAANGMDGFTSNVRSWPNALGFREGSVILMWVRTADGGEGGGGGLAEETDR